MKLHDVLLLKCNENITYNKDDNITIDIDNSNADAELMFLLKHVS